MTACACAGAGKPVAGKAINPVSARWRGGRRARHRRSAAAGRDGARQHARVQRLYGAAHDLAPHSAPGQGTRVEVRLPYRRAPGDGAVVGWEAAVEAASG